MSDAPAGSSHGSFAQGNMPTRRSSMAHMNENALEHLSVPERGGENSLSAHLVSRSGPSHTSRSRRASGVTQYMPSENGSSPGANSGLYGGANGAGGGQYGGGVGGAAIALALAHAMSTSATAQVATQQQQPLPPPRPSAVALIRPKSERFTQVEVKAEAPTAGWLSKIKGLWKDKDKKSAGR